MKIIVGLGNPGKEYDITRHNVGFMFLEYLEKKYDFKIEKNMFESKIADIIFDKQRIIFVKPQTFMNLSGNAVSKLKNWYKVDQSDILVVFDDIDIPFGDIKYKLNGSGGTHNGMKNIVQMLNSKEFPRLKIGIGGLRKESQDLASFVLSKFSNNELNKLEDIFAVAEEKIQVFLDKKRF